MSRIAVMMSENRAEAPLSGHFGRAEWLLIANPENRTFAFVSNEGGNGKSVVEMLQAHDCKDVVFAEIGEGAQQLLQAAGIQGWIAPQSITAQQALAMLEHRRLQAAAASTHGLRSGGCGCEHSEPEPETGAHSGCCGACRQS